MVQKRVRLTSIRLEDFSKGDKVRQSFEKDQYLLVNSTSKPNHV